MVSIECEILWLGECSWKLEVVNYKFYLSIWDLSWMVNHDKRVWWVKANCDIYMYINSCCGWVYFKYCLIVICDIHTFMHHIISFIYWDHGVVTCVMVYDCWTLHMVTVVCDILASAALCGWWPEARGYREIARRVCEWLLS